MVRATARLAGLAALALLALAAVLALAACGDDSDEPAGARPADFTITYRWAEGSLPPPHHYEYEITAGPGAEGEIVFRPDYPGDDTPVWREPFPVSAEQLDRVWELAVEHGVLDDDWREGDPLVGGSSERVTATADGATHEVPSSAVLTPDQVAKLKPLYEALRALVPEATFQGLTARRQQYVDQHSP